MEPWLKYNYYCSFRSVLHVYKMKRTFSKQFSCIRNEKQVCEAFCIITKSENLFLKRFSLLQIKNILSKRFAYLQNEKKRVFEACFICAKWQIRFGIVLHFVRWKKHVYESFCLFRKETNLTFLKRFSFCKDAKHVFEAFWMFTKS